MRRVQLGAVSLDERNSARSCGSSRMSTKSEKNMADFDGENLCSDDEEIVQLTSTPHCAPAGVKRASASRNMCDVINEEFKTNNSSTTRLHFTCTG